MFIPENTKAIEKIEEEKGANPQRRIKSKKYLVPFQLVTVILASHFFAMLQIHRKECCYSKDIVYHRLSKERYLQNVPIVPKTKLHDQELFMQ